MLTAPCSETERRAPAPAGPRPRSGAPPRRIGARICALAALVVVTASWMGMLGELRGELAFARFLHARRAAGVAADAGQLARQVRQASVEAELTMRLSRGNPDSLRDVSRACLRWSTRAELDPLLRLRLAERAARAAALAVRAAPSDYDRWHSLALAQTAIGLGRQAATSLQRARELAPPGMAIEPIRTGGPPAGTTAALAPKEDAASEPD